MSAVLDMLLPSPGSQVKTVCGGLVQFERATPRSPYRDGWLYFCLPVCQDLFESDPQFSCLIVKENKKDSG